MKIYLNKIFYLNGNNKKQIEYQKSVLKELTEKLDKTIDIENGNIINEKIKTHQEFLESLYNILKETNNNIEENINNLNLPKDEEKQINIKEKNFEKEDKKTKIMRIFLKKS